MKLSLLHTLLLAAAFVAPALAADDDSPFPSQFDTQPPTFPNSFPPTQDSPDEPNTPVQPTTPRRPSRRRPARGGGGGNNANCPRVVRREIRDISPDQRRRYWNAIKAIMKPGRRGQPSVYDLFSRDHNDNSKLNHGFATFFPWHRIFVRRFELALQKADPHLESIPYWDWSADAQAPEISVIFSRGWYGGNGDPRRGGCISDGQFASFRPHFRTSGPACLQRAYGRGDRIPAFVFPEILAKYIAQSRTYDQYRRSIEGQPHAAVHNGIGSMFSTMHSPNDPIFWLHHGMVDKLYMDWQLVDSGRRFREYNGQGPHGMSHAGDILIPWNEPASVGTALRVYGACISYAPAIAAYRGRAPPPTQPQRPTRPPHTHGNHNKNNKRNKKKQHGKRVHGHIIHRPVHRHGRPRRPIRVTHPPPFMVPFPGFGQQMQRRSIDEDDNSFPAQVPPPQPKAMVSKLSVNPAASSSAPAATAGASNSPFPDGMATAKDVKPAPSTDSKPASSPSTNTATTKDTKPATAAKDTKPAPSTDATAKDKATPDTKPSTATPAVDTKSKDNTPAAPADKKPTDTKPTDTKPTDTKPTDTKPNPPKAEDKPAAMPNKTAPVVDASTPKPANVTDVSGTNVTVIAKPKPSDLPKFCKDASGVSLPCSDDRENILDLRAPDPIPEKYLLLNNQDVSYVRSQEEHTRKVCQQLNDLDGYISPCALYNRDDFLEQLAQKGTPFKGYYHGKVIKVTYSKKELYKGPALVSKIKQQFKNVGVPVKKPYSEVHKDIKRIIGDGADYMRKDFIGHSGTCYHEPKPEDYDEDEYCEAD